MVQKRKLKMRKPKKQRTNPCAGPGLAFVCLLLPVVLWFALWAYKPMGGLLIAFKRYDSSLGIWMSEFKGIDNFVNLVAGVNKEQFWQAFRNTFVINAYSLVFGFPVPIILAVLFFRDRQWLCPQGYPDRDLSASLPFRSNHYRHHHDVGVQRCSFHRCAGSPGFRIWDGWRKGCPCCPRPTISGLCT